MMIDLYRLPKDHPRVASRNARQSWWAEATCDWDELRWYRDLTFAYDELHLVETATELAIQFELPFVLPIRGVG